MKTYLYVFIVIFFIHICSVNSNAQTGQYDVSVRITEADFDNILLTLVEARGLNWGNYNDGIVTAWFVNVDAATVDIMPNNVVKITVSLAATANFDLEFFQPTLVAHPTGTFTGDISLTGDNNEGFKLIFTPRTNNINPLTWALVSLLPSVEINLGTSILPGGLGQLFTTTIPYIETTNDEIVIGYNFAGPREVNIKNIIADRDDLSFFKVKTEEEIWETYNSPRTFYWTLNSTHESEANTTIVPYNSKNYKFRRWNQNPLYFSAFKNIVADKDKTEEILFGEVHPLILNTNLLEGGSGGKVIYEEQEHQSPMTTEGFQSPYSSRIGVPPVQQIGNHKYQFVKWSDGNTSNTRDISINGSSTFTANLKGIQISNHSAAYSNNSQRKFVRANNVLFSVHESIGKVWIEFSRDNGQTWELSNSGSSLFNGAEVKNPSIEFINLDGSTSLILVVAQLNNNGDSKIATSLSKITSTAFSELDYEEWANGDGGSFSTNNYPAIAMAGSSLFMISWVVSEGGYSFVDFGVGEIVNDGFGNLSLDYPSQNQDYISSESIIRNISLYSSKPIQIQNQNEFYSCWFAYESEESSQYSRIYVKKFDVGTNYHLNSSNSAEVSSGSGYTQNYNPSIVAFGDGARVCWLGTRMYIGEKEEESPTEGGTSILEHRVIFKDPSYYRYWNFIKTNGNTAHSPSINKTDGNTAYIFGWSEDDGSERVFANNSLNSIYTMVSTTGKDLQLSNGASTSSMYVNTFNSSSLPYSFASTIDINSFYGIQKSSGISISSGREGIVYKDSVQFYFCMGDISVDGEPVEFVELPDTLNVNNQIVINQSVVSKPFDLTNNSNFLYGVQYGIANPSTVTGILNNGKSVGFKVELIDAESNAVIGVFDDVTYNENSLNNYDNLFYQVNTSGIGSRTVKLRLQINENLNADYSISDKYSKTTMFNKQSLKEVSYQGSLAVNDYALNQNYPNPFNPGTVISYQLVAGGQVSLKVYDILGNEIVTLVDKEQESGRYQVTFDASKLASGVYICRIIAGDFVKTIKMSLVK